MGHLCRSALNYPCIRLGPGWVPGGEPSWMCGHSPLITEGLDRLDRDRGGDMR